MALAFWLSSAVSVMAVKRCRLSSGELSRFGEKRVSDAIGDEETGLLDEAIHLGFEGRNFAVAFCFQENAQSAGDPDFRLRAMARPEDSSRRESSVHTASTGSVLDFSNASNHHRLHVTR